MRPPPRPGPRMSSPSSAARAAPPRSPAGPAGGSAERSGAAKLWAGGSGRGAGAAPGRLCRTRRLCLISSPLSAAASGSQSSQQGDGGNFSPTHTCTSPFPGRRGRGRSSQHTGEPTPATRRGRSRPRPGAPYLSGARRSCAVAVREGARSREPSGRRRAEGRAFLGLC